PGLVVAQGPPPEDEEEHAVVGGGDRLPHAVAEGQRLLAAGVGVEPERGIAVDHQDQVVELLILTEDGEEGPRLQRRIVVGAPEPEGRLRLVEAGEPGGEHLLAGLGEQLREVPGAEGVGGKGSGDDVHVAQFPKVRSFHYGYFSRAGGTMTAATPFSRASWLKWARSASQIPRSLASWASIATTNWSRTCTACAVGRSSPRAAEEATPLSLSSSWMGKLSGSSELRFLV